MASSSSDEKNSNSSSKSKGKKQQQQDPVILISELKRKVTESQSLHSQNVRSLLPTTKDFLLTQRSDLQVESSSPTFWDDPNSPRTKFVQEKLAFTNRLLDRMTEWENWSGECDAALSLLDEITGPSSPSDDETDSMIPVLLEECHAASNSLTTDSLRFELELLLDGPYDSSPATLLLTAGAGGTESCDFVDMLRRMYTRHAEQAGYRVTTEESAAGDVVGFKSVTLRIENDEGGGGGKNAYGWFRGEKGAHRLVRLSPFNSNNKRQTTFAGVDVFPVLSDEAVTKVEIPPGDLEITTMKSGGKGGQNVNKVESGVRIRHVPTGIAVRCTQERSQYQNREIGMKRIKSMLLAVAQEQRVKEVKAIRGDAVEAAWGTQIRNYVLQPYKMVKDARSGWETSDAIGFLDGDLEECIGEVLRVRSREERAAKEEEELTQ